MLLRFMKCKRKSSSQFRASNEKLTFSSLYHFPWPSRFQPADVNLSSFSCRSRSYTWGMIIWFVVTPIWTDWLFLLLVRQLVLSPLLHLISSTREAVLCSNFWWSMSEAAFLARSINGLLADLHNWLGVKVLEVAVPHSDKAILLFISSCLPNSISSSLDSAARWWDPLICAYKCSL